MDTAAIGPLVEVSWLKDHLHDADLKVVDVRWYLSAKLRGGDAYEEGHIPGALFLDLDTDLSAPLGPGRHPLPDQEAFERSMRRAGIADADFVVGYDDAGGSIAARLWWLLRWYGHPRVAVLDGGLQAWVAAGGALSKETPERTPSDFRAKPPPREWILEKDTVRRMTKAGHAALLDVRAPERYQGVFEPVDARPGHIPGAKNAPWSDTLEGGRLKTPDALRRQYALLGVRTDEPAVVYCGSGVTACLPLLALSLAGLPGKLYPGGWSEWASDSSLPAETSP
jgi:thiosulfate/3-mercaptopyruvate sulfurtransferase